MSETSPPWLARIRGAPVTVALTVIDVAVFLFAEMHGRTTEASTLVRFGAVESHLVWSGQYWRLATYMFLHIGWVHLIWNAYASFGWCTRVERELGHVRFLVVYLLAGIAGGAASTVLEYPVSAGASGAMFGMVGATLTLRRRALPSFAAAWADPPTRATLANIAIWIVVGVTAMPMNNRAHVGGLVAGAFATWIFTAKRRAPLWIAYGTAFSALLAFATRPWARHDAPPPERTVDDALVAQCEKGVLAACHAFAITMPDYVGDTTRELDSMCDLGDLDACAAWGWTLAHGRPGVVRDEPRGTALLARACSRGSAWGCAMAKGASPVEALDARQDPANAGGAARCEPSRARFAEVTPPFFTRVMARLVTGSSVHTRMGSFELVVYPGYEGRNPRTGAVVPVAAKRVPRFIASEELAMRALGRHAMPPPTEPGDATPPSVDVVCSDAELDAVARALVDCEEVEIPGLGTLSAPGLADEGPLVVLISSLAVLNALNGDPARRLDASRLHE